MRDGRRLLSMSAVVLLRPCWCQRAHGDRERWQKIVVNVSSGAPTALLVSESTRGPSEMAEDCCQCQQWCSYDPAGVREHTRTVRDGRRLLSMSAVVLLRPCWCQRAHVDRQRWQKIVVNVSSGAPTTLLVSESTRGPSEDCCQCQQWCSYDPAGVREHTGIVRDGRRLLSMSAVVLLRPCWCQRAHEDRQRWQKIVVNVSSGAPTTLLVSESTRGP